MIILRARCGGGRPLALQVRRHGWREVLGGDEARCRGRLDQGSDVGQLAIGVELVFAARCFKSAVAILTILI